MSTFDYDLFVIGAGSGGVRAGRLTAALGKRVAVAEEYRTGGTCVIRGCVPKKLMVYASEFAKQVKTARAFGWAVSDPAFSWNAFLSAKDTEIQRLSDIYAANLQKAGAELINDRAELVGTNEIYLVNQARTVTAETILIATGGAPFVPDIPGAALAITSNEAFHLPTLPERVVVVGGGYIAVEFAGIFHGLGVKTTLVHRGDKVLRGFDDDVREHLTSELIQGGLDIRLSVTPVRIEKTAAGLACHLSDGSVLVADRVMFATGRKPYVAGLGLESAGVALSDSGAIAVDAYSRTNVPGIWAVGDVTDRVALTPVAIREAVAFVETAFKGNPTAFDHTKIPYAVFSQPPVGVVGMTETEAADAFGPLDVYVTRFRPMKSSFSGSSERTLMKLVVRRSDQQVLGVHIVGPDSPEMIQLAAIAVKQGVTKAQWDSTCALHPTAAEELVTMSTPRA
ncbi:MAG: glutathione-disulfide reductase [Asticcacaulis sp.]